MKPEENKLLFNVYFETGEKYQYFGNIPKY